MKALKRLWCRWFGHKWGTTTLMNDVTHGANWTTVTAVYVKQCQKCDAVERVTPLGTKGYYCAATATYNFTDCNPDS